MFEMKIWINIPALLLESNAYLCHRGPKLNHEDTFTLDRRLYVAAHPRAPFWQVRMSRF